MNSVTALVPLKGASERVENKNMRLFAGKPLCLWIIETLSRCAVIDRIIVNTDSESIIQTLCDVPGVVIHRRPEFLRGHHIAMNDIIGWDLDADEASGCEHYMQTHATNPLLTCATICRALDTYFSQLPQYDSLFSVTPLQTRLYTAEGKGLNHAPEVLVNTQDLPVLYEENSNIYLFSRASFEYAGRRRIGLTPFMFPMRKNEAVDIDTLDDFLLAEALCTANQNSAS